MDRHGLAWKSGLIVAIALLCVWALVPTYYSMKLPREQRNNLAELQKTLPAWAPPAKFRLNLGLDLQGGIHMVMRVDTKTALQKRVERRAYRLEDNLKDKKLVVTAEPRLDKLQIFVKPQDPSTLDAVRRSSPRTETSAWSAARTAGW